MEKEESKPAVRVAVLIVSYNCVDALRRCLAALEGSAERETIEIIVADNGSEDGSSHLDAEFPATSFLRMPRNFGMTKALNIAVRTATAEWLFILSPYIAVEPDTIPALLRRTEGDASVGAVTPLVVDESGKPVRRFYRLPSDPKAVAEASRGDGPPLEDPETSADEVAVEFPDLKAMFVSRYFVRGMNFFDERYGQFWDDAELAFQLRRGGKKIVLLNRVKVTQVDAHEPAVLQTAKARNLLAADRAIGASVYASKRFGFLSGLSLRIGSILSALGRFDFSLFMALVSGQKIDGTQQGL